MSEKKLNKNELISLIAETGNKPKAEAERALDLIIKSFKSAFISGKGVTIVGFGTFNIKTRKEREGINPRTQEKMTIKASKQLTFTPGKTIKEAIQ